MDDCGEGVQRRANRSAREQDVVDEDDHPVVDPARRFLGVPERADPAQPQIVAEQGDVEGPDRYLGRGEDRDAFGQPPRERDATGRDAEQRDREGVLRRVLDDLVGDAVEGAGDIGGGEDDLRVAGRRAGMIRHRAS